jgi:hypothetical protein
MEQEKEKERQSVKEGMPKWGDYLCKLDKVPVLSKKHQSQNNNKKYIKYKI